jgi:hypothetical protein
MVAPILVAVGGASISKGTAIATSQTGRRLEIFATSPCPLAKLFLK